VSVPVPLDRLRAAIAERAGAAYLLTVSDAATPHAVHVAVRWEGDHLAVQTGKRSAANAAARTTVSLLFPARTPDDYSLIVDGTASAGAGDDDRTVAIAPMKAVLHRPAAAPNPAAGCADDCVPLVSAKPSD
jgi:hypothetical protein